MSPPRYRVDSFGHISSHSSKGEATWLGQIHIHHEHMTWLGSFSPEAHDLLHVATAIHHVDRLAPRASSGRLTQPDLLPRNLSLEVEVAEPDRWNAVLPDLAKLLRWLTDDHWSLAFHYAQRQRTEQRDCHFDRMAEADEVGLFSGGLDSLAGARARLKKKDRSIYLFSSLGTSVREEFLKNTLLPLKDVRTRYRWIGFRHQLRNGSALVEAPHRTRGFLFLASAAAVAYTLGVSSVATYECGVGALNQPMNDAQTGAQNTRAMHPRTLSSIEQLLQTLLDRRIRMEAPFFLMTKGELCQEVREELKELASHSLSCDETERSKPDLNHCGLCTSCLLRRVSLASVLGAGDPTRYRSHETVRSGEYQIAAFEQQSRTFSAFSSYRELSSHAPTVDDAVDFLLKRTLAPCTRSEIQAQLLSLFQRHAAEVLSFYERERPRSLPRPPRHTGAKQCLLLSR